MNPPRRLVVSIDEQTLKVFEGSDCLREFPVSTSAKGMGCQNDSLRTPTGRFRICEMIGEGVPAGTIFKARKPVGQWRAGDGRDGDLILSRILRLDGLDPENANTFDRFVYIHGTNEEDRIGQPASHGCIRLRNMDMIELFGIVGLGDELEVLPARQKKGGLCFISCDSVLSGIEGMDVLAGMRGADVKTPVEEMTRDVVLGRMPVAQGLEARMHLIRPGRKLLDRLAASYIEHVTPGVARFVFELKGRGWTPVVLSGGLAPAIRPLADELGIDHVEAVPVWCDGDGEYTGYDKAHPCATNGGKRLLVGDWREAMQPSKVVMIGHGGPDFGCSTVADRCVFYHPEGRELEGEGPLVGRICASNDPDRFLDLIGET